MLHKSVLLNESIELLNIKEDGIYVDCTLGYGGHSGEILKRINKGFLFAFDQDEYAVNYSYEKLVDIFYKYGEEKFNEAMKAMREMASEA